MTMNGESAITCRGLLLHGACSAGVSNGLTERFVYDLRAVGNDLCTEGC